MKTIQVRITIEVAFQHVCFPFKKINLVTFQGEALLTFLREIGFLSSKFHSIIEVLTVQKRVNKVAFLLSNALRVSTAASLKVVSNTADPRLRFGSLSESVLDPVPRIRFSRVRSWPAFTITLDTKVSVVLRCGRFGAPRKNYVTVRSTSKFCLSIAILRCGWWVINIYETIN